MDKITASWAGKAAYAMISNVGLSGKEAGKMARDFAFELLDYNVAITTIDPVVYALRHFGLAHNKPLHVAVGNKPDRTWVELQRSIRNCWQPSDWPRLPTYEDIQEDYLP